MKQTVYEQLCGMATVFRQNKDRYGNLEYKEIQESIEFLICKVKKVSGNADIKGKLNVKLPKVEKL